ncbi:hypothetical protein [Rhizobium mayense]|uniref:hypothetical protein n=1 Tax=Rhizobium mayense TaxID=1312184 RepID=UPI00398C4F6D
MATRLSFPAIFRLITATFFLSVISVASATESKETPEERPMNFALVKNGNCQESCVQWISGEGKITADTPTDSKDFSRSSEAKHFP